MNHFVKNSLVYCVVTGRETPALFYIFKGVVDEKSTKDNIHKVVDIECLENDDVLRLKVFGNYFLSGNVNYKTYKKLSKFKDYSLLCEGRQCFSTYDEAIAYRTKLEYDFMNYFLKSGLLIANRNRKFSKYRDAFSSLFDYITRQRVDDIVKK